jgi:two-component system response regulator (stage 0 sporulation protein F)
VASDNNEIRPSRSIREKRFSDKQFRIPARIFVAEDDDEMRLLLSEAFVYDGYDVVDLASGRELFNLLHRAIELGKEPDIVVSDIRMPGMTGLEVLNRIRDKGLKMPVVLITAFGDEETLNAASRMGATAVFNKPFDIDDLRMAVAYFVAERLKSNPRYSDHPK